MSRATIEVRSRTDSAVEGEDGSPLNAQRPILCRMQTAVTLMVLVTRQKQSWPAFQLINVAISSLVLLVVSRLAFLPSLFLHFHVAVAPRGAVCNATAAMTDRAPLSHATSRRRYDDSQSLLPSLVGSVRFFNLSLKRFFRPPRFAWDLNKKPSFPQPSYSFFGPSLSVL